MAAKEEREFSPTHLEVWHCGSCRVDKKLDMWPTTCCGSSRKVSERQTVTILSYWKCVAGTVATQEMSVKDNVQLTSDKKWQAYY